MRTYQIKDINGGFMYEFINCCIGLIIAVKSRDDEAVKIQFNKLDKWELEMYKQNKLVEFARNDKSPGVATVQLIQLLERF